MVDKKLLRMVIRGCLFAFDDVPVPNAGCVSRHDRWRDVLPSDEEWQAFADLVREIRTELTNVDLEGYRSAVKDLDWRYGR